MSDKLILRLPDDLASWLTESARKAGVSRERFVRMELERAWKASKQPFMRLVGAIEGSPDLSTRKGFSKKVKAITRQGPVAPG